MILRALTRLGCLLAVLVVLPATHGELLLGAYSSTKPLKIMPVGDSITDNCVTNGAWRAYLQPLLETAGIPFTNVGRQTSSGFTGFNKVRHEGYCGSVIGPPGVYGAYQYTTTNAYLQRIVADAMAITNYRPDIMLILIGANDIGRGRNPWIVATNHMPALLDIVFSNSPATHVILAKTTTLQDASLGYGPFATNVPIYNAALQNMVNQRRALGQNVFLSDMFSAVDYTTMFLSDHLHPNPLGLKAIAAEWATRIQTLLVRGDVATVQLVNGGASWAYWDSGQDPDPSWAQPGFDDSAWNRGIARLGYGDPATATVVSYGTDPTNRNVTTWFRRPFVVPWNVVITNLNFRIARTGGAVVWLNGQEAFRVNLPGGTISSTNLAVVPMNGFTPHIFYPRKLDVAGLPAGTNWLAVELHQNSVTNTTLGFDLELLGTGYVLPTPALSIAPAGTNVAVSWPAGNSAGFQFQSTTNLGNPPSWQPAPPPPQTNGAVLVVTQAVDTPAKFFRLQRP